MIEAFIKVNRCDLEECVESFYSLEDICYPDFDIWITKEFSNIIEMREYLVEEACELLKSKSYFHVFESGLDFVNKNKYSFIVSRISRYMSENIDIDVEVFHESVYLNIASEFDKARKTYLEELEAKKKLSEEKKAKQQSTAEVEKRRKLYEKLKKEFG